MWKGVGRDIDPYQIWIKKLNYIVGIRINKLTESFPYICGFQLAV